MYIKRRLDREQLRQYVACASEMQAEGLCLQIPEDWMETCPVKVTRATLSGRVCENYGLFCYVIPVQVVAYGRVHICDYQVYSELEDIAIPLPYIRVRKGRFRWGNLDYAAEEVLNDRLEEGLHFNFSGQIFEGVIIAHGGEVPSDYESIRTATVQVNLTDSLGRRSEEIPIRLPLAARATRQKTTAPSCRTAPERAKGSSLYEPSVESVVVPPANALTGLLSRVVPVAGTSEKPMTTEDF